ncbi:MAG: glycoside hydrolase family 88 protein [Cyclobacteriaceae bacterium]
MKKDINLLSTMFCMVIFLVSCKHSPSQKLEASLEATPKRMSLTEIDHTFQVARQHIGHSWKEVSKNMEFPRSTEKGLKPISDWTSGFYPGILWLTYQYTKDPSLLQYSKIATKALEEEKYNTSDHDIGFRISCSYGNGYKLTRDPEYADVLVQAAKSAIQRYSPQVKSIKSWESRESRDWQYPVIIDNMMNLELLFEATRLTGDSTYYDIAVNHALTTMKHHYRKDYSCPHVVDYDSLTGQFRKMDWNNGYSDPDVAAWSRGQSWGLYGFTMVYRETGDTRFLNHAENIARFILGHKNMPDDMVPYWDYNAPNIPTLRDASAGAILASGLLELSRYSQKHGQWFFESGEKILTSLASPNYLAEPGTNNNFILRHATGNYLRESEKDGTLIYADYYFLEGLLRYLELTES